MNVIVSIGRNVGSAPMSDADWSAFRVDLMNLMKTRCSAIYFAGEGNGQYLDVPEESFSMIGEIDFGNQMLDMSNPRTNAFAEVVHSLGNLAKQYKQESIACTFGNPIFAGSP